MHFTGAFGARIGPAAKIAGLIATHSDRLI